MSHTKTIVYKIRYYSILGLFLLFNLILFIFSSCQEETEQITPPLSGNVILPNSEVAHLIQRIALNDGSSDNIIDHSSCTTLEFPFTVRVNGQEIEIASKEDFTTVERIIDEFENDNDRVSIVFPVTVTLADHTQRIINENEALQNIIDQCTEGGHDEDIECVDFQYPLTFSVYNSNNQLSDVLAINNDQELFDFFDTREKDDLVAFKFPIIIILSGGEEITMNNNDQLRAFIENAIDDCDEDDDNDHNDDDADNSGFNAALTTGAWEISYFFDGTDETGVFADFVFTFNADGTATAAHGVSSTNGTWKSYGDQGFLELGLDFGSETPLDNIQEDWELIEFSDATIKLKDVNEIDDTVSTLNFKKK